MDKKKLRSMWVTDAQWAALKVAGNGNASNAIREYADLLRCAGCDRYVVKGCPVHDVTEVPQKKRKAKNIPRPKPPTRPPDMT